MTPQDILKFWYEEIPSKKWWAKDLAFDEQIRTRFGDIHAQASRCELYPWRETADGRLAEIIILDQFSRNMFRDKPEAFTQDPLVLALAQEAVSVGADGELDVEKRSFLFMPFMHSESKLIHEKAVELFSVPGLEGTLKIEFSHKKIIDRFGRYPHRNIILGRQSTPEEEAFLKEPNSSF